MYFACMLQGTLVCIISMLIFLWFGRRTMDTRRRLTQRFSARQALEIIQNIDDDDSGDANEDSGSEYGDTTTNAQNAVSAIASSTENDDDDDEQGSSSDQPPVNFNPQPSASGRGRGGCRSANTIIVQHYAKHNV